MPGYRSTIYIIKFYFIVVGHISVMGGGSSHGVAVLITALVSVSPRILLPIPKRRKVNNLSLRESQKEREKALVSLRAPVDNRSNAGVLPATIEAR